MKLRTALVVITGCMFSGKTLELFREKHRLEAAKHKPVILKPSQDLRNPYVVRTRDGLEVRANEFSDPRYFSHVCRNERVVMVDESQFLGIEFIPTIEEMLREGKRLVFAGLNTDFRGQPFGIMPQLLAMADEIRQRVAFCMVCGEDATRTQRLANYGTKEEPDFGPAPYDGPIIDKPGVYAYEARCREHHEMGVGPSRLPA